MLGGQHSPSFHSHNSFGFKHKPTMSISVLCSVTVGCARQYVASSHVLSIHTIPFTCCSYSVGDSQKSDESPQRTLWSSPQDAQPLSLFQCLTAPGSAFPIILHIPPGTASCPGAGMWKAGETRGVLRGEVGNSNLLFGTLFTTGCLQSSDPGQAIPPLNSSGNPFHQV